MAIAVNDVAAGSYSAAVHFDRRTARRRNSRREISPIGLDSEVSTFVLIFSHDAIGLGRQGKKGRGVSGIAGIFAPSE